MPSSWSTKPAGTCPRASSCRPISPSFCCRRSAQSSTRSRTSGSSCATTGSPTASSNPTTISSTIVVRHGTSSSTSLGASCPSDCANGPTGSDQWDLVLLHIIQHLEACGVDLYLDQQSIDTTTPMGKLVFQVTGAFAEFERTMIRQRVKAGLKRAVAQGVRLGRLKIDSATERKVRRQLAKGVGILKVARSLGIGTGTVQRIASER